MGIWDIAKSAASYAANRVNEDVNTMRNSYDSSYDRYSRMGKESLKEEYKRLSSSSSASPKTAGQMKALREVAESKGYLKQK